MKLATLKGVYTIQAGDGFLENLAFGLIKTFPQEKLAHTRIYLPTRRACRDVTEAFLKHTKGAGLLPRAYPLGDVDEDDFNFSEVEPALVESEIATQLPPAISHTERNFLLAPLIQAKHTNENVSKLPLAGALRLAEALGKFLDELTTEQTDPKAIKGLQPEFFAEHWQKVMQFLEIVIDAWPCVLDQRGQIDATTRRQALLNAQASLWLEQTPTSPVVIAGSTGSTKSTRALMTSLLTAPEGIIVLPGFELETDKAEIEAILNTPTHPQHVMMETLKHLELEPSDVQVWSGNESERHRSRRRFLQEAMRPAERVHQWRNLTSEELIQGIQGINRIDAPNEEAEARVIALWLRQQIENGPAALVTPDRALARRVATELKRWNIETDDSAGQALIETQVGSFLRLIAAATAPDASVLDLLALLKHPLTAGGMSRPRFRRRARAIEIKIWRNDKLQRRARSLDATIEILRSEGEILLADFATQISNAIHPLTQLNIGKPLELSKFVEAHIQTAEVLASNEQNPGENTLWQGDSGEAAARLIGELLDASHSSPNLLAEDYAEVVCNFLSNAVVRKRRKTTTKIAILGVLEARLLSWPAVAIGGLEEGIWPRPPTANPWISRGMRLAIGMSDPERRIGLSAHDFANLASLPNVLLTHSTRRDGAPTKPSRWLSRLDAITAAFGKTNLRSEEKKYLDWSTNLDPSLPDEVMPPPNFAPPIKSRPRKLSASSIIRLRDDPYAVYADKILNLRVLKTLDPVPSPADRGTIIHSIYEEFLTKWPVILPPNIEATLEEISKEIFSDYNRDPTVAVFWQSAFSRAAKWAATAETNRRINLKVVRTLAELRGEATLAAPAGTFQIHARADRVDILASGEIAIADIKTGSAPSKKEIQTGRAAQLPLEAAIACYGELSALGPLRTKALSIWRLGGRDGGNVVEIQDSAVNEALEIVWTGVTRLISSFDDPNTPYLSEPRGPVRYSDYRVLARRRIDLGDET